jgi:glycosyltransferase involved in cell wall biosynthesis
MMKPLVSVLIPAYNAEEWIADSIRSAIAQTWPNKEIVVVDDGSKDRTATIADEFAAQGVRVVRQPNQGAAAARNTAFTASSGAFIQWLDADDLLGPSKIAAQMAALEPWTNKRVLASGGWGQFLYRPAKAEFIPTPLWANLSPVEWLQRKMSMNLHMQTGTWLVSREATVAAGPWDTRLLGDDDGEYFCRILLQSDAIIFVPEARIFYRMAGSGSLSYIGLSNKKMDAQFRSMQLHIEYLRSLEDSPKTRSASVQYLQNWLHNFYPDRPDIVERARELARALGGEIHPPEFSWKYAWMQPLLGPSRTKRAQVLLPQIRWALARRWDKALLRLNPSADDLS